LGRSPGEAENKKEAGSDLPVIFGVPSGSQITLLTELPLLSLLNGGDFNGGLGRCRVVISVGIPPVATDIFLDFLLKLQTYPVLLLGLDHGRHLPNYFDVIIHPFL
jgi:hypothetical protein